MAVRTNKLFSCLLTITFVASSLNAARTITNPADVSALRNLYESLNSSSQLTGWSSNGTDPCGDLWAGVQCAGSAITEIHLSGLGLTGGLGYRLDQLTSLTVLDLSQNQITGGLPYQLPPNLKLLNLGSNKFLGSSGNFPYSLTVMTDLAYMNVSNNQLSGIISDVFGNLTKLTTLDLSNNNLTGELPRSFSKLSSLSTLHLQDNSLSGNLNLLANLPLEDLNVEKNHFNGWIPSFFSSIPNLKDNGNNFSTSQSSSTPPSYISPPPFQSPREGSIIGGPDQLSSHANTSEISGGTHSIFSTGAIAGITIASFLAVIVAALLIRSFWLKSQKDIHDEEKQHSALSALQTFNSPLTIVFRENQTGKLKLSPANMPLKPPPSEHFKVPNESDFDRNSSRKRTKSSIAAMTYTVADLQRATNSFSQENLLGEGSMGRVFKAELPNGKLLAVKKMDALSCVEEEDILEMVSNISCLRHANIAHLVGYCIEHGQCLFVYNYFSKGTLHNMLHCADDTSTREITWNARMKIALGTARALEYLHEVCMPSVVHKNFKSANVMLDEDLNPQLADSGIAAFSPNLERQMSESVNYSAPEYAMSGTYTMKSDVYSFGVVMLELLTGRKPFDSTRPRPEQSLVRWAIPQLYDIDALSKMVDPALKGQYPVKSLSRFADVIALCVQPEPEFRPLMSDVVQSLVRLMQRATLNKRRPGDGQRKIHETSDSSF